MSPTRGSVAAVRAPRGPQFPGPVPHSAPVGGAPRKRTDFLCLVQPGSAISTLPPVPQGKALPAGARPAEGPWLEHGPLPTRETGVRVASPTREKWLLFWEPGGQSLRHFSPGAPQPPSLPRETVGFSCPFTQWRAWRVAPVSGQVWEAGHEAWSSLPSGAEPTPGKRQEDTGGGGGPEGGQCPPA